MERGSEGSRNSSARLKPKQLERSGQGPWLPRLLDGRAPGALIFGAAWSSAAAYTYRFLRRGWVPHDEGLIGQSAERFLNGELPHRDFLEAYTGGLTLLNALAFKIFGLNLVSPRIVVFLFALVWMAAFYWIARRFFQPLMAAGLLWVGVVWSLPNYFVALPSWYNLFFATFAAGALLRFVEVRNLRWLLLAGLCAGLSILAKITGLFLVGAGLLFLLYLEQAEDERVSSSPLDGSYFRVICSALLLLFIAALVLLVRRQFGLAQLYHFVVPGAAVAAYLIIREWRLTHLGHSLERWRRLARVIAPFTIGVAIPIMGFSFPYVRSGSLGSLLEGVLVLPLRRLSFATAPPPPFALTVVVIAVGAVLMMPLFNEASSRRVRWLALGLLGAALVVAPFVPLVYYGVYLAARSSVPLIVIYGLWTLTRPDKGDGSSQILNQQKMAITCVLALCTLVQFPYSAPIYFAYVAPLAVLAYGSSLVTRSKGSPLQLTAPLTFAGLFGLLYLNTGFISAMGIAYRPEPYNTTLQLPRGGLQVLAGQAEDYQRVVQLLVEHAGGPYIYAGPDAPQIYFLSGYSNPTPFFYEFFSDPGFAEAQLVEMTDSLGIRAVVINHAPEFSGALPQKAKEDLRIKFPYGNLVGNFEVRWRE